MITSLRNWPLSRHCRSSMVTVIPPFSGGGGNWINLSRSGGEEGLESDHLQVSGDSNSYSLKNFWLCLPLSMHYILYTVYPKKMTHRLQSVVQS